jgi:hypothetical protein
MGQDSVKRWIHILLAIHSIKSYEQESVLGVLKFDPYPDNLLGHSEIYIGVIWYIVIPPKDRVL